MKGLYIVLIVLLSLISVCMISILIFAIINRGAGGPVERIKENIQKEEHFNIDQKKSLNFEFISSEVHIIATEEDEVRVVQYANHKLQEKRLFEASEHDTSLSVLSGERRFYFFFNFFERSSYDVFIPKSYCENITITNVSGSLEFEGDFCGNQMEVKTTSGSIRHQGTIKSKNLTLSSVSGSIQMDHLTTEQASLKTTSGSIRVENITGDQKLYTVSGSIKVENTNGGITYDTTSGSIKIGQFHMTKDSSLKTVSGSIRVILSEDTSCEISTKTVSGHITTPNDSHLVGTNPVNRLSLKTTSGSIKVEQ